MPVNITFRTQLIGAVHDFCKKSQLKVLADSLNLVELIVLLARYQEEGVELCPKVYLTSDIEGLAQMLPGGERLKIGTTTADPVGLRQSLKKCAPLATGDWMIYISGSLDVIEYGVFKGESNPISVPVDAILLSKDNEIPAVRVSQVAADCVETESSLGDKHYVFLNHRGDDSPPPLQYLYRLVESMISQTDHDIREPVSSYLNKLLYESLRQSHGCLIAVSSTTAVPEFLKDGVLLDAPIDFAKLVREVAKKEIDSAQLDSKGALLRGMLNSDGIIVFDNKANLLAFNCFVKADQGGKLVGGARRRAFATLSAAVGLQLSAAFMQSQDGWSDYKGQ